MPENDEIRIKNAKERVKKALELKKQEVEQTAKQAVWEQHTNSDARAMVKILSDAKATVTQIDIAIGYLEKDSTESIPIASHLEIVLATAINAASKVKPETE
jgi:hypothetical protein